jgi:hypothetical protein
MGEWRYRSTIIDLGPGRFTSGERAAGTRWIGGSVSPRAGLDDVDERNVFVPAGNRTLVVQPVAVPTELLRLSS